MTLLSRRAFVTWLAAAVPVAGFVRRAHAAAVDHIAADPRTLEAVGSAVLPAELGPTGITSVARDFQQWIAQHRASAELLHGYGTSKLTFSGPSPATHWSLQLEALQAAAIAQHRRAFADLPLMRRRELITADLTALKVAAIPSVERAPHVALAILAHFYSSSAATDLCYEANIGRQTCRPLGSSSRQPLPLAARRS